MADKIVANQGLGSGESLDVERLLALAAPQWYGYLSGYLSGKLLAKLQELSLFLQQELANRAIIYPPQSQWFRALTLTPPDKVRAVILGQDPYHGKGQANGLSFSVAKGCAIPPSLRNIFKELQDDLGGQGGVSPLDGDLESWARQGVLLLNSALTVRAGEAASHAGRGWEELTDALISCANSLPQSIAFMFWGKAAADKARLIRNRHHLILSAPHPSPLSAHRGWFKTKHFSATNQFLTRHGQASIDW